MKNRPIASTLPAELPTTRPRPLQHFREMASLMEYAMNTLSFRCSPRLTIFVLLAVILFAGTSLADNYYVNASTGSNATGNGTQSSPWKTITYGLSQISGTGHVLYVDSGTYNTTLGETFPIAVKNGVSLVGAGIDVSIVDAGGTNIVMRCAGIVDATTRIEGFTIKGGNVSGTMQSGGSGFYISGGSALTITNNKVTGNSNYSAGYGGGIYVSSSTPSILNNVITGNSPGTFGDGGGIYVVNASPLIRGNRVVGNIGYGSGVYVTGSSSAPRILNNVIAKNKEGGIECVGSSKARIINNTISDNTGTGIIINYAQPDTILNNIISLNTGYGISESGTTSDPGKVWYNLFNANGSGVYQDEGSTDYYTSVALNSGAAEAKNNLDGDPLFLDYFAGDYHVRSGSPAVDGGDPASDYGVEPAPNGGRIEIGAYGNTLLATQSGGVLPTLTDFYVNASTGSNSTGAGTLASPWKTITYALGQFSGSGRTLHVASGTYNRTLGEKFPIAVKNGVSLVGAGIDVSIIDAGGTDLVLWCAGVVDATTRIEGLTIKGGNVSGTMQSGGSGLYISGGSALTVTNNKITGNSNYSAGYGGGIYVSSSTPLILNNVITGNSPGTFGHGAGIYVANASPVIKGNSIVSNISYGSGIYVTGSLSSPRILNNVIAKNKEGGIECAGSSKARIINNTITDNTLNGIQISYASPDSIVNNIISSNTGYGISESEATSDPGKVWYNLFNANGSGLYQDEGTTDYYTSATLNSGVAEAKNNLDGDPMFVDYVNGDYHLRSGSPAINAGDPGSPLDPDATRADIGAYYYGQTLSIPSAPALSSPANNATAQPTTLTLSWGSSAGATKYHLQVSLSWSLSTFIVNDSSLTGTSNSTGPLTNGTFYYWRVRAGNSVGWSSFSASWNFTTLASLPTLSTTAATSVTSTSATLNGNVNSNGAPTTAWFGFGTSSALTVFTSTGSQSVGAGTGFVSVTANLTGLSSNTTYYFRAIAQNVAGLQQGSILSFSTRAAGPLGSLCVSVSGNDANSGTANAPLRNIQTALARAYNGDTVKAAAGSYAENLTTSARVVLRGGYDASFSESTRDFVGNKTILKPTSGIALSDGLSSSIDGFVIDGTGGAGNGIVVTAGHSIITHNVVYGMSAASGTCIQVNSGGSATIRNNTVANSNKLPTVGGTIVYSIYVKGNADAAGVVQNNIAYNSDVGIYLGSTLGVVSGYNCSYGNAYYNFDGAGAAAGDFSKDPKFRNASGNDFYLSWDSPCIDAGEPSSPTDPDGTRADVGAYYYSGGAVPSTPTLTSPSNGATSQPTTLTLSWGSATSATKYHLQVSLSSTFASFVLNDSSVTATSKSVGPLTNGKTYYWRVRAGNSAGWSAFSSSRSFATTAVTPQAICVSPSGNDANSGTASAPLRNIQTALTRASSGDTVKVSSGSYEEIMSTTVKVVLRGGYDNSFSETARDYVGNKSILRPTAGTVLSDGLSSTIDGFVIDGSGGAAKGIVVTAGHAIVTHNVVYGISASGGTCIQVTGATSATIMNNTVANNKLSGGGTIIYSIYVNGNADGAAVILNNIAYNNNVGVSIISSWGGISGYNCSYGNSYANFDGAAATATDILKDPIFRGVGAYDFRLSAGSPCIDAGDPSSPLDPDGTRADIGAYYFSSVISIPPSPSLSSPAHGSTSQPLIIAMTWGSSTGATKYHLQVSTSLGFSNFVVDDSTLGGTTRSVGPLAAGTTHYWRVRAGNSAGWSGFSASWAFTTASSAPAWAVQSSGISATLFSVKAVNANVAWACGAKGTILRTLDGGTTWTQMSPVVSSLGCYSIEALDANTAWVVGLNGGLPISVLYKTTNGGSTWTLQLTSSDLTTSYDAVRFYDANNGILLGDPEGGYFVIYTTTNGGNSWSRTASANIPTPATGEYGVTNNLSISGNNAWFSTVNTSGGNPRVFRSTDRGRTWQVSVSVSGLGNELSTTAFASETVGLVQGINGNIIRTTDGGASWASMIITGSSVGGSVDFATPTAAVFLGPAGQNGLSLDAGLTWSARSTPDTTTMYHISFSSSTDGWAVGNRGTIWKWAGGVLSGPPWVTTSSTTNIGPASATLHAIVIPNANATNAQFEWGTTTAVSNATAVQALGAGTNPLPISATLSGLTPNTTYFVRATAQNSSGMTKGSMTSFTTLPLAGDPYEPNNTSASATPIAYNFQSSGAEIGLSGDVDYYKFNAVSGEFVSIEVETDPNGFLNVRVSLYDPAWTELASSDIVSTGTERILFGIDKTQTYYIRVVDAADTGSFPNAVGATSLRKGQATAKVSASSQMGRSIQQTGPYTMTLTRGAPLPPQFITAGTGFDGIVPLRWIRPQSNAPSGYRIYRSTSSTGPFNLVGATWDEGFIDLTAANGVSYYYTVKSVYVATNAESPASNIVRATPRANGYKVTSGFALIKPTLDGKIRSGEWADAQVQDITVKRTLTPSSSVTMYLKNDDQTLYIAVEDSNARRSMYNFMIIAFDRDLNKTWDQSSPSNEGFITIDDSAGVPIVQFYGVTYDYPDVHVDDGIRDPKGVTAKFSYEPKSLHYEVALDLSRAAPAASGLDGMGLFVAVVSNDSLHGESPLGALRYAPITFAEVKLSKATVARLPGEYASDASTILLLHMNETIGTIVSDASTHSANGVAIGTTIVDGRFGKTRSFDGVSERISIPSSTVLNVSPNLTLEAWIKMAAFSGNNMVLRKNGPNEQNGYYLGFAGSGTILHMAVNTKIGLGTNTTINPALFLDDKWHHIAGTYDGNAARVYIDGVLIDQDVFGVTIGTNSTDPVSIGANDVYGEYLNGLIDEVRISNKARSPGEFNLQLPPKNLSASSVGLSVDLSWQNGGGAVGLLRYKIYRGADSTKVSLIDSATSLLYSNTGLTPGTRYFYRVSAVDSTGFEGASSYAVSAQTGTGGGAPIVATNTAASIGSTTATLNGSVNPNGLATTLAFEWGTNSALSSYASTTTQSLGASGSSASVKADLTGLTESTVYYFRVMAQNSLGTQRSSILSFTTLPKAVTLSSPADAATNQTTSPTLSWNASPGAIRYRLQLSTSSSFTTVLLDDSTLTTTSRQVGPLAYSTTYYWHVRVTTAAVIGLYSQTFSFSTVQTPPTTISLSTSVVFPSKSKPSEYAATDYRLFGLPGASNLSLGTLLTGTRNTDWQAYWDNGAASNYLVEYDGSSTFQCALGRAFWVIAKGALNVNRQVTAAPLNSSLEAEIPLIGGWNLITNPFSSTIAWSKVQSLNGTTSPIYGFNGSFATSTSFDPYAGYYFYNSSPTLSLLKVPYVGIFSRAEDPPEPTPGEWRINVVLASGDIIDGSTMFGVSPHAKTDLDPLDYRKPRGVSSLPCVYFDRPEWDADQPAFATDVRPEIAGVQRWNFITNNVPNKPSSLVFRGLATVPPELEIYLIDELNGSSQNLRRDSVYHFTAPTSSSKFSILVGSKDLVLQKAAEVVPTRFSLSQNFPNPFNPSTSIAVEVPFAENVTLTIYNALGQAVRVLHTGVLQPGRHWFQWDAKDDRRNSVPSGAYYCRMMDPEGMSLVTRMLLVK